MPGVPKRAGHHVLDGQIHIGLRCHDDRVLSRSFGEQPQIRAPRAETFGGFDATGEDHLIGLAHQLFPKRTRVDAVQFDECQQILGNACLPHDLCQKGARPPCQIGGLEQDPRTSRQRGQRPARRNRHREVPRRGHKGCVNGLEGGAIQIVECFSQTRVVQSEIGGFGYLNIALIEQLSGLRSSHLDELTAVVLKSLAHGPKYRGALSPGFGCPRTLRSPHPGDDVLDLLGSRDHMSDPRPERARFHAPGNLLRPHNVRHEGGICIRRVIESGGNRGRRVAILHAVGSEVQIARFHKFGSRPEVGRLVAANRVLVKIEHVRHEVCRSRVFLEAPHEIGNSNVIFSGANHGDVVEKRTDRIAHGA